MPSLPPALWLAERWCSQLLTVNTDIFRGLFIIDGKGILRQITINDLPVGRSVDEALRLVQAFQYTDEHGEGEWAHIHGGSYVTRYTAPLSVTYADIHCLLYHLGDMDVRTLKKIQLRAMSAGSFSSGGRDNLNIRMERWEVIKIYREDI